MENVRQISNQGDVHKKQSFLQQNTLSYQSSGIHFHEDYNHDNGNRSESFQQQHIRPGLSAVDNYQQQSNQKVSFKKRVFSSSV
jgi:hypothetical protein